MRNYLPRLTAQINLKGVLDIDTVKGCTLGTGKYPNGGCYGLCYAFKMAKARGFNFRKSISRYLMHKDRDKIINVVYEHKPSWFRIGVMGDPCHDWINTLNICEWLCYLSTPIIITKHWISIPERLLSRFSRCGVIINTSISALDSKLEIIHRLNQFNRMKNAGIKSILRVVSCKFGNTDRGKRATDIQSKLFDNNPIIDNPLRIPLNDFRVKTGDILANRHKDINSCSSISIFDKNTYIGTCDRCPDQCGFSL